MSRREEQAVAPRGRCGGSTCRCRAGATAAATTTSASFAVRPCSVTTTGSTLRRLRSRSSRSAMFITFWTWIHEWSDIPSRSAVTCCAYHQAFSCMSALTASRNAASLGLRSAGARICICGDRFFVHRQRNFPGAAVVTCDDRAKTRSPDPACCRACCRRAPSAAPQWTKYDRPETNGMVVDKDVPITMSDGVDPERGRLPARQARPLPGARSRRRRTTRIGPLAVGQRVPRAARLRARRRGRARHRRLAGQLGLVRAERAARRPRGRPSGRASSRGATARSAATARRTWRSPSSRPRAQRPKGLKAIFPIVPMADSYRDITFSGGQTNVSFIPLWLGLVTGTSLIPPAYALDGDPADLVRGLTTLATPRDERRRLPAQHGPERHRGRRHRLRRPVLEDALADRAARPDQGAGVRRRRPPRPLPARRAARLRAAQAARADARLIMGPWTHLSGSSGDGLADNGLPSLDQIALRWFDRWLKGIEHEDRARSRRSRSGPTAGRSTRRSADWPDPRLRPTRQYLRAGNALSAEQADGRRGARTASSSSPSRASARRARASGRPASPSRSRARTTTASTSDRRELHDRAARAATCTLNGPIAARPVARRPARATPCVSVRVTDVAPDGTSTGAERRLARGAASASSTRQKSRARARQAGPAVASVHARVGAARRGGQADASSTSRCSRSNAVIQKGHSLRVSVEPERLPARRAAAAAVLELARAARCRCCTTPSTRRR